MGSDLSQTEIEILLALVNQTQLHATDIAKNIDTHPITTARICGRLAEQNLLELHGQEFFRITDAGQQRVKSDYDLRQSQYE